MAQKELTNQTITRNREFISLEAYKEQNILRISYTETLVVNGVVISTTTKFYTRNYPAWEASQLGVAIFGMISNDLTFDDIQTKDGLLDENGNVIESPEE